METTSLRKPYARIPRADEPGHDDLRIRCLSKPLSSCQDCRLRPSDESRFRSSAQCLDPRPYGRVSWHGVFPLSDSMDHVGPLTKDVRDTALMMNVIAGYDPHDPTTSKRPVPDYTASLIGNIDAVRVGIPQPYFFEVLQPSVRDAVSLNAVR